MLESPLAVVAQEAVKSSGTTALITVLITGLACVCVTTLVMLVVLLTRAYESGIFRSGLARLVEDSLGHRDAEEATAVTGREAQRINSLRETANRDADEDDGDVERRLFEIFEQLVGREAIHQLEDRSRQLQGEHMDRVRLLTADLDMDLVQWCKEIRRARGKALRQLWLAGVRDWWPVVLRSAIDRVGNRAQVVGVIGSTIFLIVWLGLAGIGSAPDVTGTAVSVSFTVTSLVAIAGGFFWDIRKLFIISQEGRRKRWQIDVDLLALLAAFLMTSWSLQRSVAREPSPPPVEPAATTDEVSDGWTVLVLGGFWTVIVWLFCRSVPHWLRQIADGIHRGPLTSSSAARFSLTSRTFMMTWAVAAMVALPYGMFVDRVPDEPDPLVFEVAFVFVGLVFIAGHLATILLLIWGVLRRMRERAARSRVYQDAGLTPLTIRHPAPEALLATAAWLVLVGLFAVLPWSETVEGYAALLVVGVFVFLILRWLVNMFRICRDDRLLTRAWARQQRESLRRRRNSAGDD